MINRNFDLNRICILKLSVYQIWIWILKWNCRIGLGFEKPFISAKWSSG